MADGIEPVVQAAGVAGAAGGIGRVLLALHAGERRWPALALDACLGAALGVMGAAACIYWDASLRSDPWLPLIIGGVGGFAGALGTRLLDLVMDVLKRRLGA